MFFVGKCWHAIHIKVGRILATVAVVHFGTEAAFNGTSLVFPQRVLYTSTQADALSQVVSPGQFSTRHETTPACPGQFTGQTETAFFQLPEREKVSNIHSCAARDSLRAGDSGLRVASQFSLHTLPELKVTMSLKYLSTGSGVTSLLFT